MATTYRKDVHEIGVTNVGSAGAGTDVIGMMLARTKDNAPAWEEYDGDYLADQFFTGAPSQAFINPEEELIMGQDDWRSGFGLEFYDPSDEKRYFSSIGMDLRHKGMAIAGNTPTAVTLPTHTISDWNNAVHHLDAGGWTNEANVYDGNTGTYAYVAGSGAGAWSNYLTIYIPAISCSQIRYWWSEESPNGVDDLEIDVYYNGAWTTVVSDDSQGEDAYATASLGGTYTVMAARFRMHDNSTGTQLRMNSIQFYAVVAAIQAYPRKGKDFNDHMYFPLGNALAKMNGSTGTVTIITAFLVNITSIEVMRISGADYLFIALGTSNAYWYINTAEEETQTNAAVTSFEFFQLVNAATPVMWGNDGVNTIRSTTNPLNGGVAWSTQTTVDSAYNSITNLFSKSGALYISKEDMIYYLSSTGTVQNDLAPVLTSLTNSLSGKNALTDGDVIMYPAGTQSLLYIDGTDLTWLSPGLFCTNLSDFVGRVFAIARDDMYWFAIVDNSTKVEILAGRYETIGSATVWVWHPIGEITLTGCETAWVSSIYQKRLWIASNTAAESLYYIALPTSYGNMASDANRNFKTGTTFETPWLHGGFKSEDKAWIKLTLTMGHTYNAGRYFTVGYKKLGDANWTNIGNFAGSATSMVESKYIDTTNKPFTAMMKFQFTAVTDATTVTPILNRYEARAIMYPAIRRMIHCVVRCAEEVQTKMAGIIDKNMFDTIKTTLDNARNNAVWPVSIRDLNGTTLNVKFLPVPQSLKRMIIIKKEKGREEERLYHCLLLEVDLS